jgi:hypothetical protein
MAKRGRRRGSFDKDRDYKGAVAKMLALIAEGAKGRAAAGVVSEETGIPLSTLRRHLAARLKRRPGVIDTIDLLEIRPNTPEEMEKQRARELRRAEREASERPKLKPKPPAIIEHLRWLPPGFPPKKRR